jgi:hypothetical protein
LGWNYTESKKVLYIKMRITNKTIDKAKKVKPGYEVKRVKPAITAKK